ncbi:DUF7689 domain-containing protein [Scytonema hofmannii]|uniref:DUF7689 domain-containing protein n=1 Tax=Scytonema hofmannii TaxID=34078 RepID=UPI0003487BCC|nr:hypothetical protein [Scytonema hofmannii]
MALYSQQPPLLLICTNGKWSKLDQWEDIEHELDGLTSEMYESVKQILKRSLLKY